ncbi:MAG: hypothetical protein WD100_02755 [Tistlia sp.]
MRLFIALSLPAEVRERLALLGHGLPSVRWVAPESLHLSLRFLGELEAPRPATSTTSSRPSTCRSSS